VRIAALKPRGPYSLRLSTRLASDATRRVSDGCLRAVFRCVDALEVAEARQRPDGAVVIRARCTEAIEQMRFVLALDDDHSEFLARFAGDRLLGRTIRHLRGFRPPRCATVAQAVLRALCGQLITSRRAREIERIVLRATTPKLGDLQGPPTCADLGRPAPAELRALGLGGPRASALVRICRAVDLEKLRGVSTDAAAARLIRESRIGPWSVGVVCLQGLGRYERGLVGDLGLVKLCSALRGRWVEAWETAELLEPYGEWAGLASVYLLAGFGRGLVPVPRQLAA
jgi:3-methyladenine DNA glycosylase/8-oxoguanine DNA glycosylase